MGCERLLLALADAISANPSAAATAALERLAQDPALASYRPDILHDLAGQTQRRRDAEYDRPDWSKTVSALANGAPATVADLHALLVAELRDEANRIARTNTDIYKAFWNTTVMLGQRFRGPRRRAAIPSWTGCGRG